MEQGTAEMLVSAQIALDDALANFDHARRNVIIAAQAVRNATRDLERPGPSGPAASNVVAFRPRKIA